MITKISSQNIGSLADFTSPELQRFALIYGKNGSGKSTLAAILRSLENNDATAIEERLTVNSKRQPYACIQAGETSIEFDGSWAGQSQYKLAVFDDDYVNKNIHSGGQLENDHKKRLYSIVLGENCQDLLQDLQELDQKSKDHNARVRELEREIESAIPADLSLAEFEKLKPNPDIENKIAEQKAKIQAISEREKINSSDGYSELELPQVANSIYTTLKRSIQTIANDAEVTVKKHFESSTNQVATSWIQKGLDYQQDELCPFCGTETTGNEIVAAYQGFFSDEYNQLKAEVKSLGGLVDSYFGESMLLKQQRFVDGNRAAETFWQQYIEVPSLDHSVFEEFAREVGELREKAHGAIKKKQSSPLEPIVLGELKFDTEFFERIKDYNSLVSVANERIEAFRSTNESVDLRQEEHKLSMLLAVQARYSSNLESKIEEFSSADRTKKAIAGEKKAMKAKIEKETSEVFQSHGMRINHVLEKLGANFRIGKLATNNATKPPSAKIFLKYTDGSIALGPSTKEKQRIFGSTLSGGERTMLGFAFFHARLMAAQDRSEHICVIDDPVSNLDHERIDGLADLVCSTLGDCKQLIVMSHNRSLLSALEKGLDAQLLEIENKDGVVGLVNA